MPIAMRMLVDAARKRTTVTYGDIKRGIESTGIKKFSSIADEQIGHVVGSLMNRIIEYYPDSRPPPINALVLNKTKKLPGPGVGVYINDYLPNVTYSRLSDARKREALPIVHEAIWRYPHWAEVARKIFKVSSALAPKVDDGDRDGKLARRGFGGPPESEEHIRLKQYVLAHPDHFGAPKGCAGVPEKRLQSLDEVDVWFMALGEQLAVEVKSVRSHDMDLKRGIFQCVKYRSVLQAEAIWDKTNPKVRARLVTERRLPDEYSRCAKRLGVEVQTLKPLGNTKRGKNSACSGPVPASRRWLLCVSRHELRSCGSRCSGSCTSTRQSGPRFAMNSTRLVPVARRVDGNSRPRTPSRISRSPSSQLGGSCRSMRARYFQSQPASA